MYNSTPNNFLSDAEASAIQTCETNTAQISVDRFVDLAGKVKYLSVFCYVRHIFD